MTGCIRRLGYAFVALAATGGPALAQQGPYSPAPSNPICVRLEGQLALVNRGGDPSRAEQVRRAEDALNKQQVELDRQLAQSRRLGCENFGLFSLFANPPAQCAPLNSQIQEMRSTIARMQAELQRMQGGGELESQRQTLIAALAQNNCGPQYQAAANQQRGFLGGLFGGGWSAPSDALQSSTYRTLCVRTCDGYYFPISFSATPAKFPEDEQTCQRMCPAAEVALYSHRNPGEDVAQAVSTAGRAYRDLPTAFRYRQEYNPSCSCRRPGQSWAEALGATRDTTVERGDIVVTQERAKALSQPRVDAQGRPVLRGTADAPQSPAPSEPQTEPAKRSVRTVGPTFVPAR